MKRTLWLAVTVVALVALMAVAGCASSTPATTSTTTPPATSNPGSPQTNSEGFVSIVNMAFAPENVTVNVGSKVTWTNNDSVTHTVTGSDFDSGPLAPGKTFSHTFASAGTFDYKCTIHPTMLGKITVQ